MDIPKKKTEILKLIERLNSEKGRGKKGRTALTRQRGQLLELKGKRERLGLDLLEERLLYICQILRLRIARIEEIVRLESAKGAAPPGSRSARGATIAPESKSQEAGAAGASRDEAYSLAGDVEETILSDILQMLSSNGKSGTFVLEHEGTRLELYFREGNLYHATGEGMIGQSAFFAAMATETGHFFFDETAALPEEKTIEGNTQLMILEALRQIDEERGG